MANTKYPQLQLFTLYSSGSSIGDTSVVLTELKTIDGVELTMADFGDKAFTTLEPGSGTNEEQISFTGITQNANGTATLTGVKTVLFLSPYTETSGLAKQHSGGSTVSFSITSGLLNQFSNKGNSESITGAWQFSNAAIATYDSHPTFSTDTQIIDKKYADDLAIAGAPDANTTTKGIVEIATGAELAAGTGTGSTGAVIVPAGSSFKNTSAGAGDANKVPVLDASGLLDKTFLPGSTASAKGAVELATDAELAAGTATGSSGPLAATGSSFKAASSTTIANDANKVPVLDSNGAIDQPFIALVGTAGESISIGQGVYLKASDSKYYKTVASVTETTTSFAGIAISAASANGTFRIARPGMVATGLSGLTAGSSYYITAVAGTLTTTATTPNVKVGTALSTTTMLVTYQKKPTETEIFLPLSGSVNTNGWLGLICADNGSITSGSAVFCIPSGATITSIKVAMSDTGYVSGSDVVLQADLYAAADGGTYIFNTVNSSGQVTFTYGTTANVMKIWTLSASAYNAVSSGIPASVKISRVATDAADNLAGSSFYIFGVYITYA